MDLAVAYVRLNTLVPGIVALDGAAGAIDPHALEVDANGNQNHVYVPDDCSVDRVDRL